MGCFPAGGQISGKLQAAQPPAAHTAPRRHTGPDADPSRGVTGRVQAPTPPGSSLSPTQAPLQEWGNERVMGWIREAGVINKED